MSRISTLLLSLLSVSALSAQAGVIIGGTRIIYPSDQSEVQISLKNRDADKRYLVQSWVSNPDDSKAPFVITPPIYKMDENQQTLLHVVYTGDKAALPQDRESLFTANIKSVAAIPANLRDKNSLQFAIKTRIKLFYRPASLSANAAKTAWEKLQFSRQGDQLLVSNPTPFYVSFEKLAVGGKDIPPPETNGQPSALTMMVPPFGQQSYRIPAGSRGNVSWSAVNDYGSVTKPQQKAL